MTLAACKAEGFTINLDKDAFHLHLFNSLTAERRRRILESYLDAEEGQVVHSISDDYHPTQDLGIAGLFSCLDEKLAQDFPLLSVSQAGEDEDDCPWVVVYIGSTATISNGGVPFDVELEMATKHEEQQMEEFLKSYFPTKETGEIVWAWSW